MNAVELLQKPIAALIPSNKKELDLPLSAQQAAAFFKVNPEDFIQYKDQLPHYKKLGQQYFFPSEIIEFVKADSRQREAIQQITAERNRTQAKTRRATLAPVFDQKKTRDPDMGIIKIRVTYCREIHYYSTGIKVSKDKWAVLKRSGPILDNRVKDEGVIMLHRAIYGHSDRTGNKIAEGWMDKYQNVINKLGPNFSFPALVILMDHYGQLPAAKIAHNDILKTLRERKDQMDSEGRIGTAGQSRTAAVSLHRFVLSLTPTERVQLGLYSVGSGRAPGAVELSFNDITPAFLECYEKWMLKEGKASQKKEGPSAPAGMTTVGIYTRTIRTVFNEAIRNKTVDADAYPFGRGKYIIPQSRNPKQALTKQQIELIKNYQPESDHEQRALDFWLFSYFSNGMNTADICLLCWTDIDKSGEFFTFIRKKTQRATKSAPVIIKAFLRPETWGIISRWGTIRSSKYIFPFLTEGMSPKQQIYKIRDVLNMLNYSMKSIGQKLGIEQPLTSYVARHSYATTMNKAGVNIKHISESLGHTSIVTTERYLASFETDQVKDFLKSL